jgi:hypothetical protein
MSWLTAEELAEMRAAVLKLLPDTVVILERTWVSDGAGGGSETLAAVANGTVAARFDPIQSRNQLAVVAGQARLMEWYQATLPHDAPLVAGRVLQKGADQYDIKQLSEKHSWNVSRRAIVEKR